MMSDKKIVFITVPEITEGEKISSYLVENNLAACVNIVSNVNSIYKWEGKIENDSECLLIVKTKESLIDRIINEVKEIHSYDLPEIISIDITKGSKEYLDWIEKETS